MKKPIVTLFLLTLASSIYAQIFVKQGSSGNGTSWDQAYGDLQQALLSSNLKKGVQIWVAAGRYAPTQTGDRNASFVIPDGIVLLGGFAGGETAADQRNWRANVTVLSGEIGSPSLDDNVYSVVLTQNVGSSTVVDGFVITAGAANGTGTRGNARRSGAGWYNNGSHGISNPTIINCLFINNYGRDGAGMYNIAYKGIASPRLENCQFVNNHADLDGGAVFNDGSYGECSPTIVNCLFDENEASYGAGVINLAENGECRPSIINSVFVRNLSYVRGSSVYNNREYAGVCEANIDFKTCIFNDNKDKVGNTVSSTVNNESTQRKASAELVFKAGF